MTINKTPQTTITADLISTIGTAEAARAWLAEAATNTEDTLSAQVALLAVSVALETNLPGAAEAGSIEWAMARGNWQTAYDAAMAQPMDGWVALAKTLFVADILHQGGADEASVDVLGRAFDTYHSSPELYFPLAEALSSLGRSEDAEAARTLLRQYVPEPELVAV
jgi:hypothetical protein